MRVRLFYQTVSAGEASEKLIFLKNFIEELALCYINVQLLENNYKGYQVTDFFRKENQITYNTYDINGLSGIGASDILILDGELSEESLIKIVSEVPKNSNIILHDTVGGVSYSSSYIWDNIEGVIVNNQLDVDKYHKFSSEKTLMLSEAVNSRVFFPRNVSRPKEGVLYIGSGDENQDGNVLETVLKSNNKATICGASYSASFVSEVEKAGVKVLGDLNQNRLAKVLPYFDAAIVSPVSQMDKKAGNFPKHMLQTIACGTPLISFSWSDKWSDFKPGKDFLLCNSTENLNEYVSLVYNDRAQIEEIVRSGLRVVNRNYTYWHRVTQFLNFIKTFQSYKKVDHYLYGK